MEEPKTLFQFTKLIFRSSVMNFNLINHSFATGFLLRPIQFAFFIATLGISIAESTQAQTIEPYRGGISCSNWTSETFVVLEPGRCGIGEGGQSEYRQQVGFSCQQKDSQGRVVNSFSRYVVPGSQVWNGCK